MNETIYTSISSSNFALKPSKSVKVLWLRTKVIIKYLFSIYYSASHCFMHKGYYSEQFYKHLALTKLVDIYYLI